MPLPARTIASANDISWKTLWPYARAMRLLTRTAAPELHRSSFDRIAAIDWDGLPPVQHVAVAGSRIGYRHYAAATSRQVLILIHGSACFGDLQHPLALQIARQDAAHVYTLNMRGHGLSHGKRGHAVHDPDVFIADIATVIGHVRARMPDATIALGGHSAGGGVVLAFARSPMQHLISSYLFLSPFLGLGSDVSRPHFGGWVHLRTWRLTAVTLANALGIRRFNEKTVVDFNMKAAHDSRYVASWSFNTMLAFGPGRWQKRAAPLPADKPVLVLALTGDECFDTSRFRAAFDVIAPHAEIPAVGEGGHWDLLVHPRVSAMTVAWLRKGAAAIRGPQDAERDTAIPFRQQDRAA